MKNMTRTAMTFCCAALLALGAAACSDECGTGPIRSEEANLSSDGGSSDSNSSPEGTSGEGSSEKVSSSSSFYYSYSGYTGPRCGGVLPGHIMFDYSVGNAGTGTMVLDDSHYSDPNSAVTLLKHADGNYYPGGQGWTEGCGWECPNGGLVEEPEGSGNWVSPCYWGWNDADMLTDNSVKVGVKLMAYANPTGWGYTNGGFLYINGAASLDHAQSWHVARSVSVIFKGVAGMPVKIYARDKVRYADDEGVPAAGTTANGQWQVFTAPVSGFAVRSGATNAFDPSRVIAIGLQYELGAAAEGDPCTQCSDVARDLEWQKLAIE